MQIFFSSSFRINLTMTIATQIYEGILQAFFNAIGWLQGSMHYLNVMESLLFPRCTDKLIVSKSVLRSWMVLSFSRNWVPSPQTPNWSKQLSVEDCSLSSLIFLILKMLSNSSKLVLYSFNSHICIDAFLLFSQTD